MEEKQETIDELKEYREKLATLSEEEKKQRDLYLKGLASGTIQGPGTGFPEIDKQWLKYYSEENIKSTIPKQSAYEFMTEMNKNNKKGPFINFVGLIFKFPKFKQMINDVSYSLQQNDVKEGDVIVINSVTLPQAILLFYAANKIGAICNFVDVRTDSNGVKRFIDEGKSTFYVTLDQIYAKNADVIKETSIKKTLVISPMDMVPNFIAKIAKSKELKELSKEERKKTIAREKKMNKMISDDKFAMTWEEFYNKSKKEIKTIEYKDSRTAAIVHTSGSTGFPKSIALTNENFNAMAIQYKESDFSYEKGDNLLNIIPMFTAYGLVNALHMPLCLGITDIVYPKVVESDFPELIKKYKPNHVIAIPMHWEFLLKYKNEKDFDLSFLKTPASGGDKMSEKTEKELNEMLEQHNSKAKIVKGYGMTEVSACAVTNSNKSNDIGSVGIPLVKNNIKIINPDTLESVRTGETGEILISSPSSMKEYFNNEAESKKAILYGPEGEKWIRSGDLGHVTPDGKVEIDGRLKRMIIRKGFKISALAIENAIMQVGDIENCVVVKQKNAKDGEVPFAFITLKSICNKTSEELEKEIMSKCHELLPDFSQIEGYEVIKNIPYTPNSKVDLTKLEKYADSLVEEQVQEFNNNIR